MLDTKESWLKEGERYGTFMHSQVSASRGVSNTAFEASAIRI